MLFGVLTRKQWAEAAVVFAGLTALQPSLLGAERKAPQVFRRHVYPPPPEITPQRMPRAIELAKKHGVFLKKTGDSVEIGTRLQALVLKRKGKTWRLDSLQVGGERLQVDQSSLLGGHRSLDVPLGGMRVAKDAAHEKEVVLSGRNASAAVELAFGSSWRGEFLTSDLKLTTNAELKDADFWVGLAIPTKQEAPIVHLLAPAHAGHEWLACLITPRRRFEVDFTVFPGFSAHFREHNVRLTAVMDYGYTTFRRPPVKHPLYHQPTRRETVLPRTLRRLSPDRIVAGYGWRRFPLPAGTYRTRIHWFLEGEKTAPAPLGGHEQLVARTYLSLYDERLNRANESDVRKLAEKSLKRMAGEDCRFECAGYTGIAAKPVHPRKLEDASKWEHGYFSTLFWVYGELLYNHAFDRKERVPERIIDDLGRRELRQLKQFPYELLLTLRQRGLNETRRKTYERELKWLRRVTRWVEDPKHVWQPKRYIRPRRENHRTRPQATPMRDLSVYFMPALRGIRRAHLEPELTGRARAGASRLADATLRMVGDTWLMESRGSGIRGMGRGMEVFEAAYLHKRNPVPMGQALRLASIELSYRNTYDDLVHNHVFPGKLAAPYIDERGMVRGEDDYNSQHSILENAWILRWDTLLRHTDEILPLLVTLRYVRNAIPYSYPANVPKHLWAGRPGAPEYPTDGIMVEFIPEVGRLGKFARSEIYQASAVLHAAIAFDSYRTSHPAGFAHLTGSYTKSVLEDHDHVLIWNPMRLEKMKTDVTGRFARLEGLELEPFEFRRLILKRGKDALFAALPGNCERVTFPGRALRGLGKKAYVCTGRDGKDVRPVPPDRIEARKPCYVLIGSMKQEDAAALLPRLIREYAAPAAVKTAGYRPVRAWDRPAGAILSVDPKGKQRVSYRTFGITGFWDEPVGHHEQVKRAARLRNVEARKEKDHTTWRPAPRKKGMSYRAVGVTGPEQKWEEGTAEEYFAATRPDNYIEYTIEAPWEISKLSIDIDAQIRGLRDKIKVRYSVDGGKTFRDGIEHANREDYRMHGSFSYHGVLYGRVVQSSDLFKAELGGTKSVVVRLVLTPFDTTRFYNINLTAFE
jgi:hypothetical protein